MKSFLQYESRARQGPGVRPVFMGALACGVLLMAAPTASAGHSAMTMGGMCPHGEGLPVEGEGPAVAPPVRTEARTPVATPRAAPAQPARPAAKPAPQASTKAGSQAQAQRPAATQAQAQRPAAAQAQAQRPAAAQAPAQRQVAASKPAGKSVSTPTPAKAGGVTTAPRQVPVAGASRAQGSRGESSTQQTVAQRGVSRPLDVVAAGPALVQHETLSERPSPGNVDVAPSGDTGLSETAIILLGLLVVSAIGAVGVAARLRKRGAKRAAPLPILAEASDAAIEAELQSMIAEARTGAMRAPDGHDVAGDDREFSASR